ncbi:MAG: Uma2 family endonuclease [Burkholderiaceae bacterium]|nr:Uma2 family endonuclease [Burkholderiaceae bacterium]
MSTVITDIPPTRFKLTVEQYHRMGEVGILGENDRIELIDGELMRMAPIGSLHAGLVSRLTRLLIERCAGRAVVSPQNSVILSDVTEPQPDLSLLRWRADDYMSAVPVAPGTRLVIEVADSSLRYDRNVKLRFYAESGVPEMWIIDARRQQLLVHGEPVDGSYRNSQALPAGEAAACNALPQVRIEAGELFETGS